MGFRERHQKDQSIQFTAKSLAASSIAIFILITSCSHKQSSVPSELQKALSHPDAPALDVTALGIQLTKTGDNHSPSISRDGKKIVFVSQKRRSHSHGQVYIYDLESLKERRITYQDGECRNPSLLPNGKDVLYSSTTDELKERPLLLKKNQNTNPLYPPTELYISEVSGSDIGRLTQRPGFDGIPMLHPTKPGTILYSQFDGKQLSIWQLNKEKKQTGLFLSKKDRSILSLRPSPSSQQWAWIEKKPEGSGDWPNTEVYVGTLPLRPGNLRAISLPPGQYTEVTWMTEDKLILAGQSLKKYSQLYSLDLKTQCLQILVDSNTDLSSPQIHPDRQGLIFASASNGTSHIYYKSLSTSNECIKWQEDTKK